MSVPLLHWSWTSAIIGGLAGMALMQLLSGIEARIFGGSE